MRRKSRVLYDFIALVFLGLGIILNLSQTKSMTAMVSYFTIQSNILSTIYFFISYIFLLQGKKVENEKIRGEIMVIMTITMVVYHVSLGPGFQMNPNPNKVWTKILADFLVHTLSPLIVVVSYFFFGKKGSMKKYYPFIWIIFPALYCIYVYTYAGIDGRFYGIGGSRKFAYFFLDYEKIGLKKVWIWITLLLILIIGLSYLLIGIDKMLSKRSRK